MHQNAGNHIYEIKQI